MPDLPFTKVCPFCGRTAEARAQAHGQQHDPLARLWSDQAQWSQAVFGADAERGPIGALRHLKLEAEEAIQTTNDPVHSFSEEMADCLLLLLDAARRGGMTLGMLIEAADSKHQVNRTRTYLRTPEGVPSMHIKEDPHA